MKPKRLGELLVEAGSINPSQLEHALQQQKKWGGRLGSNLLKTGLITEKDLLRFLAAQTGTKEIDLTRVRLDPAVVRMVPQKVAEKYAIVPLAMKGKHTLVIACVDPTDLNAIDEIRFITGHKIRPMIAHYSAIIMALKNFYSAVPLSERKQARSENDDFDAPGGGHQAIDDPDLIIFGEQTNPSVSITAPDSSMSSARPLVETKSVEDDEDDEFTLDFPTESAPTASRSAPQQPGSFTMDQKLTALYRVMIQKKLVSEDEIEKELLKLWSLGKLR